MLKEAVDNIESRRSVSFRPQDGGGDLDTLGLYLQEMGKLPLLDKEEELFYGQLRLEGSEARASLEIASNPASQETLQHQIDLGLWARNKLVEHNLRLVVSLAKRHIGKAGELSLGDIIQEGVFGLIRAAEKFDPRLDLRFSTYATWWIRQSIRRGISERGHSIRYPVHISELLAKIDKVSREMTDELEHDPEPEDVAARMGLPSSRVTEVLAGALPVVSLDYRSPSDSLDSDIGGPDLYQALSSEEGDDGAFTKTFTGHRNDELQSYIDMLPHHDRLVLELRFGLRDGNGWTLESIGDALGITRERVRQREETGLRRLRLLMQDLGLSLSDFEIS